MNFAEKLLQKERERQSSQENNDNFPLDSQDEPIKSDYYGVDNLRNSPACLDFRLPDGSRKALPYSYIMELNFESGNEIQIITTTKKFKITGRNLDLLFDYLVAYRVRFVRTHTGVDVIEDGVLLVKEILIEEV